MVTKQIPLAWWFRGGQDRKKRCNVDMKKAYHQAGLVFTSLQFSTETGGPVGSRKTWQQTNCFTLIEQHWRIIVLSHARPCLFGLPVDELDWTVQGASGGATI